MEAAAVRAQMAWDSAQQQYEQVRDIEDRLVRRCLTDQGFDIFPEKAPPTGKSGDGQHSVSPDPADAARIGYNLDPRRNPKPTVEADNSAYARTSDSYKGRLTLAKYGPDTDTVSFITPDGTKVETSRAGCLGEVRAGLYGDVKEYLRLSFTADNLVRLNASHEVENDPEVLAVAERWRKCVEKAGYPDMKGPVAMKDKARQLYRGIDPADKTALDAAVTSEIKIATADATCTKSVGFGEAVAAARAKGSVKSLAKYEADMVAWSAMVRKALEKAQEMLKA
jgi:hypothetical protein